MKTDRQVLEEAIELIEDPSHWTQDCLARDDRGKIVSIIDLRATSWCARGALLRAADHKPGHNAQLTRIIGAIVRGIDDPPTPVYLDGEYEDRCILSTFNDTHLHSEVVLVMKRALTHVVD